jgi:hypothetical protein
VERTAEQDTPSDAGDLGTAAQLLFEEGKLQAAALLIDARIARREYVDTGFPVDSGGPGTDLFKVYLEVPRFLVERCTEEVITDVQNALNEVLEVEHLYVYGLAVGGWSSPQCNLAVSRPNQSCVSRRRCRRRGRGRGR